MRDCLVVPIKSVLMIEKIAFSLEVVGSRDVDCEFAVEEREELLLHNGRQLTVAIYFVGRSPGEQLLADERQFMALHVLKGELIAE